MSSTKLLRAMVANTTQKHLPPLRRPRRRGPLHKLLVLQPQVTPLGRYLRECRCRSDRRGRGLWSLRAVARRAQMSHTTLSQVETGKRRVMADDLVHLADVLGQAREELLARAGYLVAAETQDRGPEHLSATERALIVQLRTRPQLLAAVNNLLTLCP